VIRSLSWWVLCAYALGIFLAANFCTSHYFTHG
jgi:hypothetical protein